LIGYGLRLASGYISDRTGRYWAITGLGYSVNLLAVPLLAVAGHWQIAAGLLIAERVGKSIRSPARNAMLSHATKEMGRGWGFGFHEAMDQIGATVGPLMMACSLKLKASYHFSFAILLAPALLALSVLLMARFLYPDPRELEIKTPELETKGFPREYWIYLGAASLIAAGYADFPLIAYHFEKIGTVSPIWTPIFYAIAMGVDAVAALLFGRLFDKVGLSALIIAALISAFFAPLTFLGGFKIALLGMALWGVGMGAQESIMKAAIAEMSPVNRRGAAYGIFNSGYGIFWFIGSALMGILYDKSLTALIAFSMATQLAAVPLLFLIKNRKRS
jgi:MFS family permease